MERDYVTFDQIVAVVIELGDIDEAELRARSSDGRFVPYFHLSDDSEDIAWKTIEVFHHCQLVFGYPCTARMRAAWDIAVPEARHLKRRRRNKVEWLRSHGKENEI